MSRCQRRRGVSTTGRNLRPEDAMNPAQDFGHRAAAVGAATSLDRRINHGWVESDDGIGYFGCKLLMGSGGVLFLGGVTRNRAIPWPSLDG